MAEVMSELRQDHDNMARLLAPLGPEARRLEQASRADLWVVRDIMDHMIDCPDRCPHPGEDLVFQKLLENDPDRRDTVDDLLREHPTLGLKTTQLADAVASLMLDAEAPTDPVVELVEERRAHRARPRAESAASPGAGRSAGGIEAWWRRQPMEAGL